MLDNRKMTSAGPTNTTVLQNAAEEARSIAEQMANLDVSTPEGRARFNALSAQLNALHNKEVKTAINLAKIENTIKYVGGAETIVRGAGGGDALDSACGDLITAFQASAEESRSAYTAVGTATKAGTSAAVAAARSQWQETSSALRAAVDCTKVVAEEYSMYYVRRTPGNGGDYYKGYWHFWCDGESPESGLLVEGGYSAIPVATDGTAGSGHRYEPGEERCASPSELYPTCKSLGGTCINPVSLRYYGYTTWMRYGGPLKGHTLCNAATVCGFK